MIIDEDKTQMTHLETVIPTVTDSVQIDKSDKYISLT